MLHCLIIKEEKNIKGIEVEEKILKRIDELEKKGILETMEIDISTPRISGTLIKVPQALSVHILKMADEIFISSTENLFNLIIKMLEIQ